MIWLTSLAMAGGTGSWSLTDFGEGAMHGAGWVSGYIADPWYAENGRAYPTTDHNEDDWNGSSAWGEGSPTDNWLVRIEVDPTERQRVVATYVNEDDDAFGIVSNMDDGTGYLLIHTGDGAPEPMERSEDPRVALLRVEGSDATVLAGLQVDGVTGEHTLELQVDGGALAAWLDEELLFSVTDPSPLGAGYAGVYSFDCGEVDSTPVWAADLAVEVIESSGDTGGGDGGDSGDGGDGGDSGAVDSGGDTAGPSGATGGWGTEATLTPVHPCGCSGAGGGGFALFALAAVWRRRR